LRCHSKLAGCPCGHPNTVAVTALGQPCYRRRPMSHGASPRCSWTCPCKRAGCIQLNTSAAHHVGAHHVYDKGIIKPTQLAHIMLPTRPQPCPIAWLESLSPGELPDACAIPARKAAASCTLVTPTATLHQAGCSVAGAMVELCVRSKCYHRREHSKAGARECQHSRPGTWTQLYEWLHAGRRRLWRHICACL
jgi:hypothetical protein